jgi:hypothetical protein
MDSHTVGYRKITTEEILNARVSVKLHTNGAVSVEGCTDDPDLCIILLQAALDAVRESKRRRTKAGIIIPDSSVRVNPIHTEGGYK